MNFPTACDDSNLLEQRGVFLCESERPEIRIAASLKKLLSLSETRNGSTPGNRSGKTPQRRKKFKDPELGGARIGGRRKERR